MPKNTDPNQSQLFIGKEGQWNLLNKTAEQLDIEEQQRKVAPVDCLGQTFPGDSARREHYMKLLAEKLKDPEFRKTPGFPQGTDEDILRMSDPPYYTACPNPFLVDFIKAYGKSHDPSVPYHRDPFAVDSSVGKTDALYKAHGYHTKVPHLAIVPSILHYTEPGDIVLDGFSGSGMTGVAAQFCGTAPAKYRSELEQDWKTTGHSPPKWGPRRVVLNDLGPAATFISAGYNLPFDVDTFDSTAQAILKTVDDELGWMYETLHTDGKTKGRVNFTVWSEVFSCSDCARDVVFVDAALDPVTKRIAEEIRCPHCGCEVSKETMTLQMESFVDTSTQEIAKRPRRRPVLIEYRVGKSRYEKRPDESDLKLIDRICKEPLPESFPTFRLPDCQMTRVGRMATTNTRAVHHLFMPRAAFGIAALWRHASAVTDVDLRRALLFAFEQGIRTLSVLNSYEPLAFSQNARGPKTFLYVPSQHAEVSPWFFFDGKLKRLANAFTDFHSVRALAAITTGDCARMPLPAASIDYIFTDPPFGANIFYADLNVITESWHRVMTDPKPEAIIDGIRSKGLYQYQDLMRACFDEYQRVLKPGRWITIVFSNSKNAIWHAIQEALGVAGFVVADVRTLDKQQGSFKQVTSTAVKQDLVISAYKPTDALVNRFRLGRSTAEDAWAFVREHLTNVPIFVKQGGKVQVIVDRTAQMLLDRMIAFHVQRGMAVPLSAGEFVEGITQRFAERDGMFFLPEQLAEYDRKRMTVAELEQLDIFVSDELSAIQWLRRTLHEKPQSFQDLQPQFMQETRSWDKHEKPLDLRVLLEENFLCYDGTVEVPSQIHRYLSSNMKDSRNLAKDDPSLRAKASDRWYVPDPKKATDLETLRERSLLKEFETYNAPGGKKLKVFRLEAVRAGFKRAWEAKDYKTIIDVAKRIPEDVLQEDQKLVMWYDNALTRAGVQ
jgi:16S rRNA G966 N2-methylase RsmD/DNA-directed RNA polymerase subunit RPC12/RpoP